MSRDNRSPEWVGLFIALLLLNFAMWQLASDLRRILVTVKRIEQIQNDTRPHH